MAEREHPGWRFFTALAAALLAASWLLPMLGIDGSDTWAHVASAVVFVGLGTWSVRSTQGGMPRHAMMGGSLLLAAGGLSLVVALLPDLLLPQIPWIVALTAAFTGLLAEFMLPEREPPVHV